MSPVGSDYPLQIVDSVLTHGADEVLAVVTSMHDLLIAPLPVGDPPLDVVAVRAPGSLRSHDPGTVLIKHRLYGEIRRRLAERPDGRLRRHWNSVLHIARRRTS